MLTSLPPLAHTRVFLDFALNGQAIDRVVIALFDLSPQLTFALYVWVPRYDSYTAASERGLSHIC